MSRRWFERVVLAAAALASVATSPRHWKLDATLPAIPDPAKATRVVVHASLPPVVEISNGTQHERMPYTELGHGDYEVLVAAGWSLDHVLIDQACHMHLFCGDDCKVPDDAFVTVTSVAPVSTWQLETETKQVSVLDPMVYSTMYTINLSTHRPVKVDVRTMAVVPPWTNTGGSQVVVSWLGVTAPTTVEWTAHLTVSGPCPTPAACQPPPGETLTITSIDKRVDAPR
jgi:hypothetical protein